jgi:tetrathionate reductase subunit B
MNMKQGKGPHPPQSGAEGKEPLPRREALTIGAVGAAGVVGAIAGYALTRKALAGGKEGAGTRRYAMVIDLRRCVGCHACSVACKSENEVPLGVWRSWVKQTERGRYPHTQRHFLPRLCNHCDHPACVEACPTNSAYRREKDGIVLIREDRCIGCKLCMAACPYDARFLHPEKQVVNKCTFCAHRVDKGVVPACVNTCQGKARIFGDLNDSNSEVSKLVAKENVQVLKPEHGTDPRVYYIHADCGTMGRVGREV